METAEEKRATFTPGPWVVGSSVTAGNKLEGCSIFAEKIKDQIGWMRFDLDEENHANARLIAAAPEMYEMCKLLEECMEFIDGRDGYDASYELAKVREVLAKVEGGEA